MKTIETLPDEVRAVEGTAVEATLIEHAARLHYDHLAKLAVHVVDVLDPDGSLRDERYREQKRHIDLITRPDGSARIVGDLTAELVETLRADYR